MAKFQRKPVVVEATQWGKHGDRDDVRPWGGRRAGGQDAERVCVYCDHTMRDHGVLDTIEGSETVCPGNWIVVGPRGERERLEATVFAAHYEPVPMQATS